VWVIALSFLVMGPAIVGPGGSSGNVQYNNSGSFGGIACGSANTVLHAGSPPACSSVVTADLPTSGVTAAAYGGGTQQTPNITFDATGRATSASNVTQSGMRVLLNTVTGSGSAAISDTTSLTATYSEYDIVFDKITVATSGAAVRFQVHIPSSFQSSGYTAAVNCMIAGTSGSTSTENQGAASGMQISNADVSNTSNTVGINGLAHLNSLTAFVNITGFSSYNTTTPHVASCVFGGLYPNNGATVDGIQLIATSGNISGTMKIYGYN
jgi:hypothetical protein